MESQECKIYGLTFNLG